LERQLAAANGEEYAEPCGFPLKQAGGPDHESNGPALCVLHHKTFDLGVFTLSAADVLLVSDWANGTDGFRESLLSFHGRVRPPRDAPASADLLAGGCLPL